MGLDMFFYRAPKGTKNIWKYIHADDENYKEEDVYMRKHNHIRQWIVDHCDYPADACDAILLNKYDIADMIEDCIKVFTSKNPEVAEELLPTADGFFFGGTDYDEDYFYKVGWDIENLSRLLVQTDWDNEEVWYAESW